jgi:hypothetical protein
MRRPPPDSDWNGLNDSNAFFPLWPVVCRERARVRKFHHLTRESFRELVALRL